MNYWSKYLDFDVIDELSEHGEPSEEEFADELKMQKALLKCNLADNLLKRAKGQ